MTLPRYNPLVTPESYIRNGKVHTICLPDSIFVFCRRNGKSQLYWENYVDKVVPYTEYLLSGLKNRKATAD